jgi:hypothetical protein
MIYGQASWYLASTEPRILHPELTRTANPRLRRLRRNLSALNPILRQIQGLPLRLRYLRRLRLLLGLLHPGARLHEAIHLDNRHPQHRLRARNRSLLPD